jgi:hypothetical protein
MKSDMVNSIITRADKIQEVLIDDIVPHPKNVNRHPEEQIERLSKIIQYQGFRDPLIISNLSGFLVSGHGRLSAAKKLGMKTLPVIFQDFESEEQEYAALVSENTIALWADLDLSQIHVDLQSLDGFDIDLLGIKDFQFETIVGEVNLGDENSEWAAQGMPDFVEHQKEIKLVYVFETEEARQKFVDENKVDIKKKASKYAWWSWIQ